MNRRFVISTGTAILASAALISCIKNPQIQNQETQMVIEVVTLKLNDGVSYADFAPIDNAVKVEHVSKQPGFISRESAAGENGEWLVIVHWRSEEEANASMASFSSAPAAAKFMDMIDPETMIMKRYKSIQT